MAKKDNAFHKLLSFVAWFTGVVVSLAVAFGLVNQTLTLPWWLGGNTSLGIALTQAVGWIVLITTLIGVILAILDR